MAILSRQFLRPLPWATAGGNSPGKDSNASRNPPKQATKRSPIWGSIQTRSFISSKKAEQDEVADGQPDGEETIVTESDKEEEAVVEEEKAPVKHGDALSNKQKAQTKKRRARARKKEKSQMVGESSVAQSGKEEEIFVEAEKAPVQQEDTPVKWKEAPGQKDHPGKEKEATIKQKDIAVKQKETPVEDDALITQEESHINEEDYLKLLAEDARKSQNHKTKYEGPNLPTKPSAYQFSKYLAKQHAVTPTAVGRAQEGRASGSASILVAGTNVETGENVENEEGWGYIKPKEQIRAEEKLKAEKLKAEKLEAENLRIKNLLAEERLEVEKLKAENLIAEEKIKA